MPFTPTELTNLTGEKRADKRLLSSIFMDVQPSVRRADSCVVTATAKKNAFSSYLREPVLDAPAVAILKHGLENENETGANDFGLQISEFFFLLLEPQVSIYLVGRC